MFVCLLVLVDSFSHLIDCFLNYLLLQFCGDGAVVVAFVIMRANFVFLAFIHC